MADESTVKKLKEQRSQLKAKLTAARNVMFKLNECNFKSIEQTFVQVDALYEQITDVHCQYCEHIASDPDSFSAYKVVNGLSLDDYIGSVDELYQAASTKYYGLKAKHLLHDVLLAIQKCEHMLSLDRKTLSVESFTQQINGHVAFCRKLSSQSIGLFTDNADIASLDKLTTELDCLRFTIGADMPRLTCSASSGSVSNTGTTPSSVSSITDSGIRPAAESTQHIDSSDIPSTPLVSDSGKTGGNKSGSSPSVGSKGDSLISPSSKNSDSIVQVSQQPYQSKGISNAGLHISGLDKLNKSSIVLSYSKCATTAPGLQALNHSSTNGVSSNDSRSRYEENFRFKKQSPPVFNGDRRKWPEFRAIWSKYASSEYRTSEERAWALRQSLQGRALECIRPVVITRPDAYELMWCKLEDEYSDVSLSVQAIYGDLDNLKMVTEGDMKGLIAFINGVEMCYSSLAEVGQLSAITMTHIDQLSDRLPLTMQKEWTRIFEQLSLGEQIHPFPQFMIYLEAERKSCKRLAARQEQKDRSMSRGNAVRKKGSVFQVTTGDSELLEPDPPHYCIDDCSVFNVTSAESSAHDLPRANDSDSSCHMASAKGSAFDNSSDKRSAYHVGEGQSFSAGAQASCMIHSSSKHKTHECKEYLSLSNDDRYKLLKANRACFKCLGNHMRRRCNSSESCKHCKLKSHHYTLCRNNQTQSVNTNVTNASINHAGVVGQSIFPVQHAPVVGVKDGLATLFFDSGSTTTFITNNAAKEWKAKAIDTAFISITAMGGHQIETDAPVYELELNTENGSTVVIAAYGVDVLTGRIAKFDLQSVQKLFPHRDVTQLQRKSSVVDLLVGMDNFGIHPEEVVDQAGKNLKIKRSPFGLVLMGHHPSLRTEYIESQFIGCHCVEVQCNLSRTEAFKFIEGEELGTEVQPRCGGC